MIERAIDWWRRRRLTGARYKGYAYYESRSEVPQSVPRQTIAVVGTYERPQWAVFECPCGRGHQITLNMSLNRRPYWRIEGEEGAPSLHPSVDAYEPYNCHYWLKDGRVTWV